jgi:hypothetical protein
MNNFYCKKCNNLCPSGILDNELCTDCNLIGTIISVFWGKFGIQSCLIHNVSKNGIVYAQRWNKKAKCYTIPKPVIYYNGVYRLNK